MVSNYNVELGNVGNSLDSDVDAAWDTSLAETGESVDPNVPVVDLLPDSGHQLEGQFDGLFGGPEPAVQFSSESGDVARPPVGSFSAADSQVDDIGSDGGTHFIFPKLCLMQSEILLHKIIHFRGSRMSGLACLTRSTTLWTSFCRSLMQFSGIAEVRASFLSIGKSRRT